MNGWVVIYFSLFSCKVTNFLFLFSVSLIWRQSWRPSLRKCWLKYKEIIQTIESLSYSLSSKNIHRTAILVKLIKSISMQCLSKFDDLNLYVIVVRPQANFQQRSWNFLCISVMLKVFLKKDKFELIYKGFWEAVSMADRKFSFSQRFSGWKETPSPAFMGKVNIIEEERKCALLTYCISYGWKEVKDTFLR